MSCMSCQFLVDQFTQQGWEHWFKAFPCANLYQTWDYGETHCRGVGRTVSRAVLLAEDRPLAAAQFRIKKIPLLNLGVAEVNWGPLWNPNEVLQEEWIQTEFLTRVRDEFMVRRGLGLQFELPGRPDENQNAKIAGIFLSNGFTRNTKKRPYRTCILDLGEGLESLRVKLNGKWRNSLNNAEKAGLEAEYGSSTTHFDRFRRIYDEMWAEKRFPTGVCMDAIRAFQARAAETNKLRIWILSDRGTDVAAGAFAALGDTAVYFLGASSPKLRKNTNSGYLLQWLNIRKSIELGFRWYDLGGVTDEPGSTVDLFKVRMGGRRFIFPGWFECSRSKTQRSLYEAFETSYRRICSIR